MEKTQTRQVIIPAVLPALLLFFPFFEPGGISFIKKPDLIFTLLAFASFAVCFAAYLINGLYSKIFIAVLVWRIYLLADGLVQRKSVDKTFILRSVLIIGFITGFELMARYNAIAALEALYVILAANLTLNLLTCFTGGIITLNSTPYFWNGMRTRFTDCVIPAVMLSFLISLKRRKRLVTLLSIFTVAVSAVQLAAEWVATGVLALALLLLFVILFRRRQRSPGWPVFVPWLAGFLIVFMRIQSWFSFIIVDLLHKDLSFHGRLVIWDSAIEEIRQSVLFGAGEAGNGGVAGVWWSDRLVPAHNDLLQHLYDGGTAGAILFAVILLICVRKLSRYRNSETAFVLMAAFLAAGTQAIAEVPHYYIYFYILPAVVSAMDYIETQKEERQISLYC